METKIQNQIIDYFSLFEEFYNTSRSCLKDCQNYAAAINKLIKRYRNIKECEVINSPLAEFDNLQNKLCAFIHNLITEEIQQIRSKLSTLEDLFEKLCHKHKLLTDNCREINLEDNSKLVKGTPLQPSLKQILEFAADTITFGSQIIAQIDTSLNVLAFKRINSDSLVDNFRVPTNWQHRVKEIITYTSFCSENEI